MSWHINPWSGKNSLIFELLVNNYVRVLKDYMLIFLKKEIMKKLLGGATSQKSQKEM